MQKELIGLKRSCLNCHKRFYDLHRSPILCPYCDAEFIIEEPEIEEVESEENVPLDKVTVPDIVSEDDIEDIEAADLEIVDEDDEAGFLETDLEEDNDVSEFISTTRKGDDGEEDDLT